MARVSKTAGILRMERIDTDLWDLCKELSDEILVMAIFVDLEGI